MKVRDRIRDEDVSLSGVVLLVGFIAFIIGLGLGIIVGVEQAHDMTRAELEKIEAFNANFDRLTESLTDVVVRLEKAVVGFSAELHFIGEPDLRPSSDD